ncbi:Eco57I restriction-modification methylase domain-containing protein [Canibacter sp. lx-72]|uniref:Eco57I restriction-modification methylase domain-containing protein n=1 Tax=Canibacter zhuwentaonis TaxID=2837491 RepID=UPI001BDCC16F|nr:Eco57I restriction-modification methylase domain-containing protein [Canibacter zhuwentaonis]MBT1018265.1 Eco57I restriction-modification methylase domain-containing protein [Canibacter zhuwentaonis]
MKQVDNIELLDNLIFGRATPHIYAFQTGTIPNYLKVGDTYRPVSVRLKEWKRKFPDLTKEYEHKATVADDVYFRDHAVHYYLEVMLGKERLQPEQLPENAAYYSREFFKEVLPVQIEDAIGDIHNQYSAKNPTYSYYKTSQRLAVTVHYERGDVWELRPNQQDAVNNFVKAVKTGRTNLLMYAVMRFGKSFTSLACAKAINAKTVLIVSAKADVREEWQKNVERPGNFIGYKFLSSQDLLANYNIVSDIHAQDETAVIFLTLQDLQGSEIKAKHAQIFENNIDLLVVDETHFGARAGSYGAILRTVQHSEEKYLKEDSKILRKQEDDRVSLDAATDQLKELKAKIRLHLSGTPYRILMGSEFESQDIISFVQFTDIASAKETWDEQNIDNDDAEEWDNPYFGFPQMIRFAFHPSQRAVEKMEDLKKDGVNLALSALLKPKSIKKDNKTKLHQQFEHEIEVLDFLRVIDGSANDSKLLGFLDYEKIKQGQMCRHMVMVLPYCASCDALEKLIADNRMDFKNLCQYEILNISGVDGSRVFRTARDIQARIAELETRGKKTLTLTVNRMLTGSTVEQWDTMLYLKDTASPQEYDQAIFRLQNQYVRELSDGKKIIKECLKPQTLLVDFDPYRLFAMQEQKSLIYNANTEKNGNAHLRERIASELRISPIIIINHNRLEQVQAADILRAVNKYNNSRSIADEVLDLPVDLSVLSDDNLRRVIESQNPFGSRGGLTLEAHESDMPGTDLDIPSKEETNQKDDSKLHSLSVLQPVLLDRSREVRDLENKIRTYYQRILFFAFLCSESVKSLDDVLENLAQEKHKRLACNLGINKRDVRALRDSLNAFKLSALDYKIQNISTLATDESLSPLERATTSLAKFSRMSASEIITPLKIADDMVGLLPEDQLRKSVESGEKLLDIASKSGEYAVALVKRLKSLGFEIDDIKDSIYAIPTSGVAYEFTQRFYEILGLNTACIASKFTSYNLLDIKTKTEEVDYAKIKDILSQNKPFADVAIEDNPEGCDSVQFGTVIGNPPYQKSLQRTSDKQIYPDFMEIGYNISGVACFISPGRFLFNAGKTAKNWNEKMLNDPHLAVPMYEPLASKVFPNTGFKGGIAITLRLENVNLGAIGTYTSFPELNSIVQKVKSAADFTSWMQDIHLQQKFNLEKLYEDYPEARSLVGSSGRERRLTTGIFQQLEVFSDAPRSDRDLRILGLINNKRVWKYIPAKYISDHPNTFSYKVIVPKSNGSGSLGEALSTPLIGEPLIGEPLIGVTQSFITFGSYPSEEISARALSYLKTKMCRVLLGSLKVTQDNNQPTWANVPAQNFAEHLDINWNCTIKELDQQLYTKYALSEKEIEFIEKNVREME